MGKPDAGLGQFRFTQSRGGDVQWEVQAQHAQVFDAEQRATLQNVHVTLFGPKGQELVMEGDEGTIDTAKKNFVLSKHSGLIAVQFQNGYTLTTNNLAWTDGERRFDTLEPVVIIGNGLKITGRGLVGKIDTEEFRILADVRLDLTQ
jgi:lipopolysaccharide export system protein LptC